MIYARDIIIDRGPRKVKREIDKFVNKKVKRLKKCVSSMLCWQCLKKVSKTLLS